MLKEYGELMISGFIRRAKKCDFENNPALCIPDNGRDKRADLGLAPQAGSQTMSMASFQHPLGSPPTIISLCLLCIADGKMLSDRQKTDGNLYYFQSYGDIEGALRRPNEQGA